MDDELRSIVLQRASSICEYCLFPAHYAELDFEIDHIIARKHRGETVTDNLALSCIYCNSGLKGTQLIKETMSCVPFLDISGHFLAWYFTTPLRSSVSSAPLR
jgi:hypothetical protein